LTVSFKGGFLTATKTLSEEVGELQKRVRADASNAKLRVHLFQLLCMMGDWKRALAQLQVCAQLDAKAIPMAQTYRETIGCEMYRMEVFAGRRVPQIMGKPPAWIGLLVEALRLDALPGNAGGAADLRAQAMDDASAIASKVDNVQCEWLADGDTRLGPVCEVIANGQYYWLPFESCAAIKIEAPIDLRDLVWAPAELMLPNEGRVPAFIPTRYPETAQTLHVHADDLKRCRVTEWTEHSADVWFGLGQRVWMSDIGEHPILDTREIHMPSFVESAST
jgi:type VI secretion system protein ImpE